MPNPERQDAIEAPLGTMQAIWLGLFSGVITFVVVSFVVRSRADAIFVQKDLMGFSSALEITGIMAALLCGLAFFTLPALVIAGQRQALAEGRYDRVLKGAEGPRSETRALAAIYQTQLIVGLAILEGAAFLNTVVFLIEGNAWNLGVTVVLIAIMATQVPTHSKLESWMADQRRLLRDEAGPSPRE